MPNVEISQLKVFIAAAEERLWSEIDAALERYSRQVLAIREARAAQQKHS